MVNYQLGKIYKIVCNTTGLVYIGSTCEPTLARRLWGHKSKYNRYLNGITTQNTNGNYNIILIANVICQNKDELHSQERHYIETLECVNKEIPGRTREQYLEDNKVSIGLKQKQYDDNNIENKKTYYLLNRDKIRERKRIKYLNSKTNI